MDATLSLGGLLLFFAPPVLVLFGWVRWLRAPNDGASHRWRGYAVAAGLAAASVSSVSYLGVTHYLRVAHLGYWNEYLVASAWGRFNWPLSLLAMVLAIPGKGASRILLLIAGCGLLLVWTTAFIH